MKPETALQRSFNEGVAAFHNLDDFTVVDPTRTKVPPNPYKMNSMFYKEWERGFNSSYFRTGNK